MTTSLAQLTNDGASVQAKTETVVLPSLLGTAGSRAAARGLYVHVPFCFHKCHYCDFYSIVDRRDRRGPFTRRLVEELASLRDVVERPLETIFVGGGTPTLLTPQQWTAVLEAFRTLPVAPDLELTVEANPETVTAELAEVLAAGGVNRVSVGCQTFDPRHLATLERWHDPAAVPRAVEHLRSAGIGRLNLDLIFGVPGQTVDEWAADLDAALALRPEHLSCYALTYEPSTPLTARMHAGRITPADEQDELAMYELAIGRLRDAGFEHYEVSAWARPGERCRHNVLYWTNGSWWAAGPSAAGHLDGLRWRNVPRLGAYLESGPWPPVVDVELPDDDRVAGESFMMGLRLLDGMPRDRVEHLLGLGRGAARRRAAIEAAVDDGRLEWAAERLRLTPGGLLVADGVVLSLL